jgi:hypothetical protein
MIENADCCAITPSAHTYRLFIVKERFGLYETAEKRRPRIMLETWIFALPHP